MMLEYETSIKVHGFKLSVEVLVDGIPIRQRYGSDSDGNRGSWRVEILGLDVKVTDSHGKNITDKLRRKYVSIWDELLIEAKDRLSEAYSKERLLYY